MSDLIHTPDGYIGVGKPQALHHAYLAYPPSEDSSEGKKLWVSNLNRIFTVQRVAIGDDGKRLILELPMLYGNWEMTVSDIHSTNRPMSELENPRRNEHRYLSQKEIAHNLELQRPYKTESERITWDIFFDQWFERSSIYEHNKNALRQAVLRKESLLRLPHRKKVEERDRAIKERERLIAKGVAEWRRQSGNVSSKIIGVRLTAIDKHRLGELSGTIKLLNEILFS
jgi:hypothetical protein